MLIRVLYISDVSAGTSMEDIERLVAHARRRNRQRDLTGALLACDGHFAQALEGQELLVEEAMRKIASDPRHHDLRVQERAVITQRLFADWDMAFIDDMHCDSAFRDMLAGRVAPDAFLAAMGAWIAERKSAPL